MTDQTAIAALDVGERRVGVALAHPIALIAAPYATYFNDTTIWSHLQTFLSSEGVGLIVIGLPRDLEGQDTAQTAFSRQFAAQLRQYTSVPITFQDEALTSHLAEKELQSRSGRYNKGEVDALAATLILEDYLKSQRKV